MGNAFVIKVATESHEVFLEVSLYGLYTKTVVGRVATTIGQERRNKA